jgi:hypothetical protein
LDHREEVDMTKARHYDAEVATAGFHDDDIVPEGTPVIAHFSAKVITRVNTPIYGGGTGTIGQFVDNQLEMLARKGSEVMSVTVMLPEKE